MLQARDSRTKHYLSQRLDIEIIADRLDSQKKKLNQNHIDPSSIFLHCVLKLVMDEAVRINGECWDKDSDKLDLEYDEFVSEDEDSDEDEYDI